MTQPEQPMMGADQPPVDEPVVPEIVPARQPAMIPPYVADTGSEFGLRQVQTEAASLWTGVPTGDQLVDSMNDASGLISAVYESIGYDGGAGPIPPGTTASRASVSELQPSDIVAWNGGWRGQDYVGHLAVYMGNGEIVEQVGNQPAARRKLHENENVFGVKINM